MEGDYSTLTNISDNVGLYLKYFTALCTDRNGLLYVGLKVNTAGFGTTTGAGDVYVATSNCLYLSANYGNTITKVPMPADVRLPVIRYVNVDRKGTLYMTVDAYFVNRPDYSVSNCYYTSDKGATWRHVTARGFGTDEMRVRGFDADNRLIATFSDITKVPAGIIDAKYIQMAITTSPVE